MLFTPWKTELAMREDDLAYFKAFYNSGEWCRLGLNGGAAMLYQAAENAARKIFVFLLENGMDVNAGYNGFTPLCGAAASGDIDVVRELVEYGARLNGNADTVCAPLITAIQHGKTDAARFLLEAGASPNHCQLWSEETPLDLARQFHRPEIEALLLERGAKSTYELPPCPEGAEREYLGYLFQKSGRMLLGQHTWETAAGPVLLRAATVPGKREKLLFTWGLSLHTSPATELCAEVPLGWDSATGGVKNHLAEQALLCCACGLSEGESLQPGEFFEFCCQGFGELRGSFFQRKARVSTPLYFGDSVEKLGIRILCLSPISVRRDTAGSRLEPVTPNQRTR